jgi:hypothetical protein
MRTRFLVGGLLLCLVPGLTARPSQTTLPITGIPVPESPSAPAQPDLRKLPLHFVENGGQLDSRIAYSLRSPGATAYFTQSGVTFSLSEQRAAQATGVSGSPARVRPAAFISSRGDSRQNWILKLDFVNASPATVARGEDSVGGVVNYLIGPRSRWHSGVQTYASIAYSQVWPGIDLVYAGADNRLKYTIIVEPDADPARIRFSYRGATSIEHLADGRLAVHTPARTLYEEKPYVYQEIDGQQVVVDAAYALEPAQADHQTYGFRLGEYRRDRPLIVDPTFRYAGYIGDDDTDIAYGVAVDSSGSAYVVGLTTASSDTTFPESAGPGPNVLSMDAFVAKVDPTGSAFTYISYLGGLNHDVGHAIAVDSAGSAYITGYTASSDTFPHGVGFAGVTSFDTTYNGGTGDAFVAKLSPDGSVIVYAGFLGGSDDETGYGIALDGSGRAYVTGGTCSSQATFPDGDGIGAVPGPDLTYNAGSGGAEFYCDAFVAKINADGDELLYAGYIGGSGYDEGHGIAVDQFGYAYVIGSTNSTQATFPDVVGPDKTYNGNGDAFVAKVKSDGSGLNYSGYLGGGGRDDGNGIALRRDLIVSGNFLSIVYTALVTGRTESNATQFPTSGGPDTTHNGSYDAFVARVSSSGSGLAFSGFIGGSSYDIGNGIAVDSQGYAYVTGATSSSQASFPEKSGPDLTYNGNGDAFIARVDKDGSQLLYAGYIGGNGLSNPNVLNDFGYGVAVDAAGNAYVAGSTFADQTQFPDGNGFGPLSGPNTTYNDYSDAFIVKIGNLVWFPF